MTPAIAVHDLLIGEHGAAFGAPVHLALLAVGQAALVHFQEEPLVPAVVLRETGGDFARPVVAKAEALHLGFHVVDVAQGPGTRGRIVRDGGIFGGQSERVPAHGVKNVVAVHPHVAGERVADGVVTDVPHVESARRVGQHLEHVILGLGGVGLGGVKSGVLLPALGPFGLHALDVVAFVAHGSFLFLWHRAVQGLIDKPTFYNVDHSIRSAFASYAARGRTEPAAARACEDALEARGESYTGHVNSGFVLKEQQQPPRARREH